jgi:hypothetical protein
VRNSAQGEANPFHDLNRLDEEKDKDHFEFFRRMWKNMMRMKDRLESDYKDVETVSNAAATN